MSSAGRLSRRRFLAGIPAGVSLLSGRPAHPAAGAEARGGTAGEDAALERLHRPALRLPPATVNGARVPVVVQLAHPMTADHSITTIQVVNERDPVPSKGIFHFSPANGHAYVAFQARLDQGRSDVSATAVCSRHGRWSSHASVSIPPGAGGCAGTASPTARAADEEILPPRIRIPDLIKRGRLERNEIIDVQIEVRHPSRTGLAFRDGTFVQASPPFYLQELLVFYGSERVSRFEMTSAFADNPFMTFRLRAVRAAPLRIVLTNNRQQRFEAVHPIHVS